MSTTFGLILLLSAFLMGRSVFLVKRSAGRDVPGELQREITHARSDVVSQIRATEAEFLESVRVLEAELDTRRAILDQLIVEADQRIADLEDRIDHAATSNQSFRKAA